MFVLPWCKRFVREYPSNPHYFHPPSSFAVRRGSIYVSAMGERRTMKRYYNYITRIYMLFCRRTSTSMCRGTRLICIALPAE